MPRRTRVGCGAANPGFLRIGCLALIAGRQIVSRPPDRDRIEEILGGPGRQILAYEVWAHILIYLPPDGRLHFNHLRLEWSRSSGHRTRPGSEPAGGTRLTRRPSRRVGA